MTATTRGTKFRPDLRKELLIGRQPARWNASATSDLYLAHRSNASRNAESPSLATSSGLSRLGNRPRTSLTQAIGWRCQV